MQISEKQQQFRIDYLKEKAFDHSQHDWKNWSHIVKKKNEKLQGATSRGFRGFLVQTIRGFLVQTILKSCRALPLNI